MIEAVFFDLGNTVVDYHSSPMDDTELDKIGLWKMHDYLKKRNVPISVDSLYDKFYLPWTSLFPSRKNMKKEIDVYDILKQIIPISQDVFKEIIIEFHEPSARMAQKVNGIDLCLKELKDKGIKIGLVSNTPLPGYCNDLTLSKLNLLEFFDVRIYSYDIGIRKPDMQIFKIVAEKLQSDISNCAMVGDSYELDIKSTINLGMKSIWFNKNVNNNLTGEENLIISNYSDLLKKLQM
jgi:HAD superfamily hydrolase (TIGR01549 family)